IAVASTGDTQIISTEFAGNAANGRGGGLSQTGASRVVIFNSTFNNNAAVGKGGGPPPPAPPSTSTLAHGNITRNNQQHKGGGIFKTGAGSLILGNNTVVLNSANSGGGLRAESALAVINSIVARNNAIVANPDVDNNATPGNLVDGGFNLIGNNTGAATSFTAGSPNSRNSFVGTAAAVVDPLLAGLADN